MCVEIYVLWVVEEKVLNFLERKTFVSRVMQWYIRDAVQLSIPQNKINAILTHLVKNAMKYCNNYNLLFF